MMQESRLTFFRQSGWVGIANTLSGVFLMAVYSVLTQRLPGPEIAIYATMLRFFAVLGLPAASIQIVMAQDAARAITVEDQRKLRATIRGVVQGIFFLWIIVAFVCGVYQVQLVEALQLTHPAQLWVAVLLVLAQLCMPFMQGLVQGLQKFLWLGISILCGGLGRFLLTVIFVLFLGTQATGVLVAALFGIIAAVGVAYWPAAHLFRGADNGFVWKDWLRRVLPLAGGTGSILFLMQADVLLVQSHFPREMTQFYIAASVIGVGLVTFTTPMAAVMFPKLVRSFAQGQRSNSLLLALLGTLVLGLLGAVTCTLWPELPLHIMFFRKPEFLQSAVLVPWVIWSMLPLTLANVLISSLMAQARFAAVPWLLLVAAGYGFVLFRYVNASQDMPVFEAFRGVIQILGLFSCLLLAVALFFAMIWPRLKRANPASESVPGTIAI